MLIGTYPIDHDPPASQPAMHTSKLCFFVYPLDSDDNIKQPSGSPTPAESPSKEDEKRRIGPARECGTHLLDLLSRLFRRLHGSRWMNLCRHERRMETQEPVFFHDLEGVQISGKLGYENPRVFSYAELYIATNGFKDTEVLGSGGFGRVYKAVLPSDGTVVAVKCLAERGDHFEKTFEAELVAVAQLRHKNLVKLRGWCVHEDELLLVYDYMPNRSLDRVLFRKNLGPEQLTWDTRKGIVNGLASALFYLHEQLETQIIHRDVKSSNVMLDTHYNARLGDFGLARWLEHELEYRPEISSFANDRFRLAESTRIGGTIGYLPPESFQKRSVATAKSDVFSFGIVVLEIISGRRAVDLTFPDDRIVLLDWVRRLSDEGKLLQAGDNRFADGSYRLYDMERSIHLALLCTLHHPHSRPNMKWVIEALSDDFLGKLPTLPSFRSHPLYISLSHAMDGSSSNTTTTTTRSTKLTPTDSSDSGYGITTFVTAQSETMYHTADEFENGNSNSRKNLSRRRSSSSFVVETPREISYKDIVSATDNFSDGRRVAEVDFGTAYHGLLHGQHHLLVKRLGMTKCPALRTRFSTELQNLAKLRHRNLIQLRGWCTEHGEMLVVYDYSAKRMLSNLLFHGGRDEVLQWQHRYSIIRSLASAIRYLHEAWDEQVIHRNITSSSVILDSDLNPRLCGFALAEFLARNDQAHQAAAKKSNSVRGIFGYMSPEYMEHGEATTMADVYSFGVVVLEMVTGEAAVDFRRPNAMLAMRVHEYAAEKRPLEGLVDIRVRSKECTREMERLVRLGILCTRSDPKRRPSMRQVESILDGKDRYLVEMEEEEERRERRRELKRTYEYSLTLIKRMQALGIH